MTPEERAAVIYDLVKDGYSFADGDVVVTASGVDLAGSMVTMTLAATRWGESVALDNPFGFVNPPLGIADGDAVIVDPEAALREMLLHAVLR